jgi:CRP/FNR family transcriptional regulator, nitrogen oxide reductase regulator
MSSTHGERLRDALAASPLFESLPAPLRERVERMATLQELEKGDVLWHAGEPSDSLTVIVSGRVKVVRHAEQGDVILEMFGPGEAVGAVAVYNEIPYPATAIAMDPCTLFRLPRRDWFDLLERDHKFTRAVLLAMTRLNMALTRKLAAMHGTRVHTRIASLFLSLAERLGRETAEGVEIPLALSRQEIAEFVGTTVESAIRVMSKWNREGVLVTGVERFVIPDREKLKTAANVGDEG